MFNLLSLLINLSSSMFYNGQYYVMDNYDKIEHNIPCEEVNSVCFEKSKSHYVKFDFLDNVNYSETHYYTKDIYSRYNKLVAYYNKNKINYNIQALGPLYSEFHDDEFDYIVQVTNSPNFIGEDCKVVSLLQFVD